MSWAEAAWIGPTLVAVVASFVQYRTHRNTLTEERERWSRERHAAVSDRRLDTVRTGYLSLMAAAGGFTAAMDSQRVHTISEFYILEWFDALKAALRESGGVVDAYGSSASRTALEEVRQLVAEALETEQLTDSAERMLQGPIAYNRENYERARENAAIALSRAAGNWRQSLGLLLDALRADVERFEAASG